MLELNVVESRLQLFSLFYISVAPEGAEILGPLQPLTADREYIIGCKVWGSNPPATIEWFIGPTPDYAHENLKALNQVKLCASEKLPLLFVFLTTKFVKNKLRKYLFVTRMFRLESL